jgi:Bacteriophage baseplate protein W
MTETFQGVGWAFPVRVATGVRQGLDQPPALQPARGEPSGPYSSEVLFDAPVDYYRLNEVSGASAGSETRSGRDGTVVGSPVFNVPGPIVSDSPPSAAVRFDGTSDRITLGVKAVWKPQRPCLEIWFKTGSTGDMALVYWSDLGCQLRMGRGGNAPGTLEFFVFDSAGTIHSSGLTSTAWNDDRWHHAVGLYDGANVAIFVDGRRRAAAAWAGTIRYVDGAGLTVGGAWTGSAFTNGFVGDLSEFALYAAPLPRTRIAAHFTAATGTATRRRVELAREERSIRESILLIVGTARGERVMRPDFGCGLHELVFEPNDSMTAARASSEVRESLIDWEPRIDVLDVSVTADGVERNKLLISVDYRIRRTNSVFNLVYPFYLESAGAQAR